MTLYQLDTDHLRFIERGTRERDVIRAHLRLLAKDDFGISNISYAEQTKGWLAKVARADTPATEVAAFGKLQISLRLCTSFAIWEYTPEAAAKCAELKAAKVRVSTQDLRIASIALVNGATLLTRNTRDFEKIPGLRFEDWSV